MTNFSTWYGQGFMCLSLAIMCVNKVNAQCNPPDQLPTPLCQNAPLVCLLGACYQTLDIDNPGPDAWCNGSNSIENAQFFAFIPTANNVEIHIHVDHCDFTGSLQAGIIGACPWNIGDVLACDGQEFPGGTIILYADELHAGDIYWLMLDGSSGALCDYTITYTNNIDIQEFEEELVSGEAIPYDVCLGADALELEVYPPIPLAHGYYWVLGWNGDTVYSTLSNITIPVPSGIEPGIYNICVRAYSGCDLSENELCIEVNVHETLNGERDPVILCWNEFPISWDELVINGPGVYERGFSAAGCDFDSIWIVESYPEPAFVIIDTFYCLPQGDFSFYYENEPYDQSGTYTLVYSDADVYGCDSIAELDLLMLGIDADASFTCGGGAFILNADVEEVIPFNAELEFQWFRQGESVPVGMGNPYVTQVQDCYDLFINVITTEGYCSFFIKTICIEGISFPTAPQVEIGDTIICPQHNANFCVIPDPLMDTIQEYVWTAPSDVIILQNGLECVDMSFSNSQGGQVCVSAVSECGNGAPTCFNIHVMPSPVAKIDFDSSICVNDITTITFTGVASPGAELIWDFNSPSSITGSGSGPYEVSWDNPGVKLITVTVIESGCDTISASYTVLVDLLSSPVINCITTLNTIEFDWNDVPGASGYLVSFNGSPSVPVMDSDTMLTNLLQGSTVELVLTTVSTGPCPEIIDTMSCTAKACPAPLIELTGDDSVCLNVPSIIDLEALVNGFPGTGTWAGTGITDVNAGIFNPKIAGPGQHQLIYTVTENDCSYNELYTISVFDSIVADFALDPVICISDVANLLYTGNASGGTVFNFDLGAAIIEAGTGAGPFQLSWNTPGQKTISLVIQEHGCMSDKVMHSIDIIAEPVAPIVQCAPSTNDVVFSWTLDPSVTGSVLNVLSGHVGTLNGLTYAFNGLVPGDIVSIEIISLSKGPCPERKDTFDCEARLCPPVELSIDPVNDICLYPGTSNIELIVAIANGNGSGEWLGPGVIDAMNGIFNPTLAGTGTHLITYHYRDDGCDFFETITINVNDVPTAMIGNTDPVITCTEGSVFLDGSNSSGSLLTYQWSTQDGTIAFGANESIAEAVKAGEYQLLIVNAGGCRDSVSIIVRQDEKIPKADAGPDKTITCDSTQFILGGVSTADVNVIYMWSTFNGNMIGPLNNMNVNANRKGDYTIIVRDTITGCQSQDNVMINIDTAVAEISLTPGDTLSCSTVISTVTSFLSEPEVDYIFNWSTLDGHVANSINDQDIEVTQGGTYTLTIHNIRNGCETSVSAFIAEIDDKINDVMVEQKNITCYGNNDGSLSIVNIEGGVPDYTFTWSVNPVADSVINFLTPAVYHLTVTDANGCSYTKEFMIIEPDLVTLDLGSNQTVKEGDSVKVSLSTSLSDNAIASIHWVANNGMLCEGCTVIDFIALSNSTFFAIITDTAGCSTIDSIQLTVIVPRLFYIPNIFSPNDDDINDYFTISGRHNLINISSFKIFDRWGNQLFEKMNLQPGVPHLGWDGKFKNETMQPGVYVFIAELKFNDYSETVSGSFTLVR